MKFEDLKEQKNISQVWVYYSAKQGLFHRRFCEGDNVPIFYSLDKIKIFVNRNWGE